MGWFGSNNNSSPTTSNNNNNNNNNNDPLRDLDPSLREFLEKESPVKYQTSAPPPTPPPPPPKPTSDPASSNNDPSSSTAPAVPPESLYQDGRYAHLWSTYRSRGEIESATKSDQEKLMDVLEGYKSRKAMIGKAALENCALEQAAMSDCYMHGSWKRRMSMCRAENGAFTRCYTMQARFLKALGYLSAHDRPPEVDERIQMHADTLYHRMLDQERAVEEAKKSNLPIPEFPPLVTEPRSPDPSSTPAPTTSTGQPISASAANLLSSAQPMSHDQTRDMYLKRILPPEAVAAQEKEWDRKGLSAEEKMLEARAMAMEAEAGLGVADQVGKIMQETKKGKEERRKQGTAGLGDTVSGWLGW
ncbi:MAG: hypothetical protein LQ339_000530 [Xanthoria mediterranea]|nr:MAG: hypothetical protein LQ339_000530 [Xanthoria mediterranea]